ncbi:MAG TPA: hypothetical protein EYP56_10730 [Planctomycetaceae bacterium]|nr:hypothetical protein [Planctomycetaceae bacterium]
MSGLISACGQFQDVVLPPHGETAEAFRRAALPHLRLILRRAARKGGRKARRPSCLENEQGLAITWGGPASAPALERAAWNLCEAVLESLRGGQAAEDGATQRCCPGTRVGRTP